MRQQKGEGVRKNTRMLVGKVRGKQEEALNGGYKERRKDEYSKYSVRYKVIR